MLFSSLEFVLGAVTVITPPAPGLQNLTTPLHAATPSCPHIFQFIININFMTLDVTCHQCSYTASLSSSESQDLQLVLIVFHSWWWDYKHHNKNNIISLLFYQLGLLLTWYWWPNLSLSEIRRLLAQEWTR
jgi:hypothetical protein